MAKPDGVGGGPPHAPPGLARVLANNTHMSDTARTQLQQRVADLPAKDLPEQVDLTRGGRPEGAGNQVDSNG